MNENENRLEFLVAETDGFSELGMHQNALAHAKMILTSEKLNAVAFQAALYAILIDGDDIENWRGLVEAAYGCLLTDDQKEVRAAMLGYYHDIKDMKRAMDFASAPTDPYGAHLLMDVCLANERPDQTRQVYVWCKNALPKAKNNHDRSMLLTAIAEYCESTGRLDGAEDCWLESSKLDEVMLQNALSGLVRIQVARAWKHLKMGLEQIEKFQPNSDPATAIRLPDNHGKLLDDAKKELETYRESLEKIVSEKDLGRFGIDEK